ncbi:Di-copper centre-containing protein [Neoconidiobolus thromboides FSU 785]|nr:Di-copper centre-containing protein [Neoconidiobolus thromboides FSU 785]
MITYTLIFYLIQLILSQCNQVVMRREIRELSSGELNEYMNAIRTLNSGPKPTRYDEFARIHLENAPFAHGTIQFLVWHREYILQFEQLLRTISPNIVLPYWDWSIDFQDPASSSVLQSFMLGGNGNPDNENCVENGIFGNMLMSYPRQHCLKRQYDLGNRMSNFFSTNSLLNMIRNSNSYQRFNNDIEMLPHARVHVNLGGNEGDMSYMFSTNDPLFWLHHTFIDKIYYEWQQQHPSLATSFPGDNNQPIPGFGTPVSQVLNTTGGGRYCYTYARFQGAPGNALAFDMQDEMEDSAKLDNSKVKPLPDDWILRNNLNPAEVRALEQEWGIGESI